MYTTEQTQINFPSPTKLFTPAITTIIMLMIIGFALVNYATEFILNNFALIAGYFLHGKIWEIITYSFINGCPWNLIINGMVILFIGSTIEREWGTRSFVLLWLVVAIVCGIIWIIVSLIAGRPFAGIGSESCVYGIIATFGILYRGTRMWFYFFTVEAQNLALILIGIGIVLSIIQPLNLIWVFGALAAYIYVKLRWRMASPGRRSTPSAQHRVSDGFVDID